MAAVELDPTVQIGQEGRGVPFQHQKGRFRRRRRHLPMQFQEPPGLAVQAGLAEVERPSRRIVVPDEGGDPPAQPLHPFDVLFVIRSLPGTGGQTFVGVEQKPLGIHAHLAALVDDRSVLFGSVEKIENHPQPKASDGNQDEEGDGVVAHKRPDGLMLWHGSLLPAPGLGDSALCLPVWAASG